MSPQGFDTTSRRFFKKHGLNADLAQIWPFLDELRARWWIWEFDLWKSRLAKKSIPTWITVQFVEGEVARRKDNEGILTLDGIVKPLECSVFLVTPRVDPRELAWPKSRKVFRTLL